MRSIACLILFAALAPEAYTQSVLYSFYGKSQDDYLGRSVSGVGDVNGLTPPTDCADRPASRVVVRLQRTRNDFLQVR